MEVSSDPSVAGVQFLFVVAPVTWQRDWGHGVKTVYPDLRESIATEGEARTLGGGLLGPTDPPPQVVLPPCAGFPNRFTVTLELRKSR